jgi:hypothetical protein
MVIVEELPKSKSWHDYFTNDWGFSSGIIVRPDPVIAAPPGLLPQKALPSFDFVIIKKGFLHPDTKEFGWLVKPYQKHLIEEVELSMLGDLREHVWDVPGMFTKELFKDLYFSNPCAEVPLGVMASTGLLGVASMTDPVTNTVIKLFQDIPFNIEAHHVIENGEDSSLTK